MDAICALLKVASGLGETPLRLLLCQDATGKGGELKHPHRTPP